MRKISKQSNPHLNRHYRSNTHWYIPHTKGRLTIKLTPLCPEVTAFIKGYTRYLIAVSSSTGMIETYKDIFSQEEFVAWRSELDAVSTTKNTPIYIDTDALPPVQWRLPNGTIIESNTIDEEVEEGETLCICNNFKYYYIDIQSNNLLIENRDFPPSRGYHKRQRNYLSDLKEIEVDTSTKFYNKPQEEVTKGYNVLNLCGTNEKPKLVRGTTEDLLNLISPVSFIAKIVINYCPYITGDLQNFKIMLYTAIDHYTDIATGKRIYHNYYKKPSDIITVNEGNPDMWKISIHHCMVSGYLRADPAYDFIDYEFYACPNVTAKDYDNFIDQIISSWNNYHIKQTSNIVGFVTPNEAQNDWVAATPGEHQWKIGYCKAAGTDVLPAFGTLKISNRTENSAVRAEKIALLREAGWLVEEIDDSLEEGIYATL